MSASPNETIQLRADMIGGRFPLAPETQEFVKFAGEEIEKLARLLAENKPADADIGRYIAAMDHLQQTKNLFCDSAVLGGEAKRRRLAAPKPKIEEILMSEKRE